ncbi:MAG: hypothetical protein ACUZ8E_12010 [Candidatus Anammoxibacter sp.]
MSGFKIGERVEHEYLGRGTVTDNNLPHFMVMVRYDRKPDMEYNMGENPTAELVSKLKRIL